VNTQDMGIYRQVLTQLPPSTLRELARAYKICELGERKYEKNVLLQPTEGESNLGIAYITAWKQLELRILIFAIGVLRLLATLLFWIRLLPEKLKEPIKDIEDGIIDASKIVHNPSTIFKNKTPDENAAEEVISNYQQIFNSLVVDFGQNREILSYVTRIRSSSLELGHRWAEVEDRYRRAKAAEDRTESFWRAGFMVRAFGFGTIKLIRGMLVVLAIGMAIPWLLDFFAQQEKTFETTHKILWGIGWTVFLWALTLILTVMLNHRRMTNIWERAHVASMRAELSRATEMSKFFNEHYMIMVGIVSILCPQDNDDPICCLIYDSLKGLKQTAEEHKNKANELEATIKEMTTKLTLRERITRFMDTSSQGDLLDP